MKVKFFLVSVIFLFWGVFLYAGDLGDVNSDGQINILDGLMTAQFYVGLNPPGFIPAMADTDGNGTVTILDALLIAQFYVGIIDKFPGTVQTPTATPVPTPTPYPEVRRFEGEQGYVNSANVISVAQASGGKVVGGINHDSNSYIEWNNIYVNYPGDYDLAIRYANGLGDGSLSILVNGKFAGSAFCPSTGGWSGSGAFAISRVRIFLNRGSNTLRIHKGTNFSEVDYIELNINGAIAPTSPPAPPANIPPGAISKYEYYDKTLAGLMGQTTGILTGMEFLRNEDKSPKIAMEDYYFKLLGGTLGGSTLDEHNYYTHLPVNGRYLSDDDEVVDIFSQHMLDTHGTGISNLDIKDEWVHHQVGDWASGEVTMKLMNSMGLLPPLTGTSAFSRNLFYLWSEPIIETETLGMAAPGMPQTAVKLSHRFVSVLGEFESIMWSKFWVAAHSIAYFETDIRSVLEQASVVMTEGSWPKRVFGICKEIYNQNPTDWRWAIREMESRRRPYFGVGYPWFEAQDINQGFAILSVLYGKNNYMDTLKIISLSGYDADCTAATVMTILGIIKGMAGTPQEIKDRLYAEGKGIYVNESRHVPKIINDYPTEMLWDEIVSLYQRNAEKFIIAGGGTVTKDYYLINREPLKAPSDIAINNSSFETGDLTGWNAWRSSGEVLVFAETGMGPHTGKFHGVVNNAGPAGEGKLFVRLKGLTPGATYRASAYLLGGLDRQLRLYAENYGGPYRYASNMAADTSKWLWTRVSLIFTAGTTSAEVGLHLTPSSTGSTWGRIDDLTLELLPSYTPGTRYEAEEAFLSQATIYHNTSASGGGYVGGINNAGAYVEFRNIQCSSAGEYVVKINYATLIEPDLLLGSHRVLVNGKEITSVKYLRTGPWGAFSGNILELPVEFKAGTNTLRLEKIGHEEVNLYAEIDYIEVAPWKTVLPF